MKELNELVEQAKFVADWHGSDWSGALCQDKDGKQAHEIICESRGEAVISTDSNSNEASWLCDYLELCSPANILAIAEAFRALEQREKEERHRADQNASYLEALTERMLESELRAEAAEARLAETSPAGWTHSLDADAALVMLDRIDTLDQADDGRIEDVKKIIRKMAEQLEAK